MASLIEGYEYDIFISYRQKDNRYDGWVTVFVDNLKRELEATVKEDLSLYFDENPEFGLKETHDVDKSLEGKLKCLVFIPIISQTYCDDKSFAWQNEFCAFNDLAKNDRLGRDIRVAGGNIASRILPVKIHELDPEDLRLVENEIGGKLRGIEFIYRAPGVNRPLRPNEERPGDNLNKTSYRDQINKVANSVKEILSALRKQSEPEKASLPQQAAGKIPSMKRKRVITLAAGALLMTLLVIAGFIFVPGLFNHKSRAELMSELTIAVMPFRNDSPDRENTYFINGIMDEVLNNLQTISGFTVLSRISVEKYRDPGKFTVDEIAKDLNVNYIVEGNGQKFGNNFVLRVQLTDTRNKRQIWSQSYNREIKATGDIISIQAEVASSIARELKTTITPEEKLLIERSPTSNMTAYDFYIRGNDEFWKGDMKKADEYFHKSLQEDPSLALAYTGLAKVYWDRQFYKEYMNQNWLDSVIFLTDKALAAEGKTAEAYVLRGRYYGSKGELDKAIAEFDKALEINPNLSEAYYRKGQYYASQDFVKCLENYTKASTLNRGAELSTNLRIMSRAYLYAGFNDKFEYYANKALALSGDSSNFLFNHGLDELYKNNFGMALDYFRKAYKADTSRYTTLENIAFVMVFLGRNKDALDHYKQYLIRAEAAGNLDLGGMHRIGYAFFINGKAREADYYLDRQVETCLKSNALGRQYTQTLSSYYDLAAVYAFRGDKEKALENLRIFNRIKIAPLWLVWYVKNDPLFDKIRDEPDFQQISREVEAKYQAEHDRTRAWLDKLKI